jgi:ketosteroid isomerase-like protein
MRYVLLLVLFACAGAPTRDQVLAPNPELTPALAEFQPWLGDWRGPGGTTHWVAADGALYGVWFKGEAFTVHVIDDGEGAKPADGVLRFIAVDDGRSYAETKDLSESERRAFAHIDGYQPVKRELAPMLEAADRAFAADTKARQIDGWVAAFDPKGGMMRKGARIDGDAIREMMADTLANGVLAWDPIASGVEGELGYTVGKATYTPNKAGERSWASTYITIWRHQPDGSWKVLFDTGRPVNR